MNLEAASRPETYRRGDVVIIYWEPVNKVILWF